MGYVTYNLSWHAAKTGNGETRRLWHDDRFFLFQADYVIAATFFAFFAFFAYFAELIITFACPKEYDGP